MVEQRLRPWRGRAGPPRPRGAGKADTAVLATSNGRRMHQHPGPRVDATRWLALTAVSDLDAKLPVVADAVTIISVSSTAAIAAFSLAKDLVLPRWQSKEERTVEARAVFDLAARRFMAALAAADAVRSALDLKQTSPTASTFDQRTALCEALKIMRESDAQLAVRVGPEHEIFRHFSAAHVALSQEWDVLHEIEFEPGDPTAPDRQRRHHHHAMAEQKAFYRATAKLSGPRRIT